MTSTPEASEIFTHNAGGQVGFAANRTRFRRIRRDARENPSSSDNWSVKKTAMGEDVTMVSVVGDRLGQLRRMAKRVAEEIDICGDARALVLLTGRLADLNREIDELDVSDTPCAADQIAARRAARRAGS
jgi:hypothetical protein